MDQSREYGSHSHAVLPFEDYFLVFAGYRKGSTLDFARSLMKNFNCEASRSSDKSNYDNLPGLLFKISH